MSASRFSTCAWIETSSAATDSSRISTCGSAASARAIATRWRWPPDSAPGQRAELPLVEADQLGRARRRVPGAVASTSRGAAAAPRRSASHPSGAGRGWSTGPGRRSAPRGRAAGARLPMRAGVERSRPQARIVPAVGRSRPTIIRATVVLPEPDSPTMASEPAGRERRTRRRRRRPASPNSLRRPIHLEDRLSRTGNRPPGVAVGAPRRGTQRHDAAPAVGRSCGVASRGSGPATCGQRARTRSPTGASNADSGRPGNRREPRRPWRRCRAGRRPARRCRGAAGRRAAALSGAGLHDLAGVHHRRAVADGGGQLQVVGDEQHRQAAVAAQLVEDRHHLGLGGDVERGGRLVGQQQARLGQQRGGDHDPLQHPAGQLVRVLAQPLRRRPRCRPRRAASTARCAPRRRGTSRSVRSASVMKSPIRRTGLMCARGSWKIIATSAAVLAQRAPAAPTTSRAVEADRSRRLRRRAAAAARSPGRSSTCPSRTRRPGRPPRRRAIVERDVAQHRRAARPPPAAARSRPSTSSSGRSPAALRRARSASRSPSRLTATTTTHDAEARRQRLERVALQDAGAGPPTTITPQSACGGCTPRPRNEIAARSTIA